MTLLLLLAACSGPSKPPSVDDSPDVPVDSPDVPEDTDPGLLSAAVSPASPGYRDDLVCVVTPSRADVVITWRLEGVAYTGPVGTTTVSGDTIGHLDQSGGQRWSCAATAPSGEMVESGPVVVGTPVPMVLVEAGTGPYKYSIRDRREHVTITLTRDYLMGAYEVTQDEYLAVTGLLLRDEPASPGYPQKMTASEAMWFANAASELDGLAPCFDCTSGPPEPQCTRPADPYACEGYRFPTHGEWFFAATERGRHMDMLPAGGNFEDQTCGFDDLACDPYELLPDQRATGPNAPPNSMVGDQCNFRFRDDPIAEPTRVGTLMPNRLGLYDLCGNVGEYMFASAPGNTHVDDENIINPIFVDDENMYIVINSDYISSPVPNSSIFSVLWTRSIMPGPGLRLTRTRYRSPP